MNRQVLTTAVTMSIILFLGALAWAQHDHPAKVEDAKPASMMQECQMMGQHMEQMRGMMKKMDQQLDEKVAAMNQATGDAKVAAMAEVINEMVSQRKRMQENMGQMQEKMMSHMARHMQMGTDDQAKKGMMDCPMMKQMTPGGESKGGMHGMMQPDQPAMQPGHEAQPSQDKQGQHDHAAH